MTAMPTGDSPFDADGHPSVEAISEYTEELLRPDQAKTVRAHLTDCAHCAETHTAIGEIRGLLGRGPTPRLPAEVSGRIDAALAAESLLAAELPDLTAEELATLGDTDEDSAVARLIAAEETRAAEECRLPVDPEWVRALIGSGLPAPEEPAETAEETPQQPQGQAQARPTAQATPADQPAGTDPAGNPAADSPAQGGAGTPTGTPHRPATPPTGPPDGRPPRGPRRFRRGRIGLLSAAGLAAAAVVVGLVVSGLPRSGSSGSASSASVRASTPGGSTTTAPAFTAAGLPREVERMLGDAAAPSTPSNGAMQPHTAAGGATGSSTGGARSAPATASTAPATPEATAPDCVTSATGHPGTPLAVESGSYRGGSTTGGPVPVYVLVYPADSAAAVDVYVVPASCSGGVLLHRQLTRP